jgi:Fic family protein
LDFDAFKAGSYRKGYQYQYFLPGKINHPFIFSDPDIGGLLERASLKLGELNSFSRLVPDTSLFIAMHISKEAVVSSRIEGTRTHIEEAFAEAAAVDPERRDDWQEVQNYIAAMQSAIAALKTLPLSNRLLCDTHRILLSTGRGAHKSPGEFRTTQNWIGGASLSDATFIPPAHLDLPDLLGDLEAFLNNPELKIPHLVRVAIAHYQFETIHPFLDGNGRIGRLLITLYLVSAGILEQPLLYLSEYLERHKSLYFDNLMRVRTHNDLARWIKFFLTGVLQTADSATATLQRILDLKHRIEAEHIVRMGKRAPSATGLLQALFRKPVVSVKDVQGLAQLSPVHGAGAVGGDDGVSAESEFRVQGICGNVPVSGKLKRPG